MIPWKKVLILCLILPFAVQCAGKKTKEVSFYVSLSGNDSWSGKLPEPSSGKTDGPFATLMKARDAVREIKKADRLPAGGVIVYIRGGAYPLSETFTLTSEDSGTKTSPVVWRAYQEEKVQIVGGKEITGFEPVKDSELSRCINKSCRDSVLQVDLKAQGITDYGDITGGPALELFFNDKRMAVARYPDEGWLKIKDVPQTGTLMFEGVKPHKRFGIYVGRHYGRFVYDGDRPNAWSDNNEIYVHGFWSWDWSDSYQKVKSINTKTNEIFIQEPHHGYGYTKDQRYYFLNIIEELNRPGEWYLDRTNGIVYFWPPSPISQGRAFVSLMKNPLMVLDNTEYVTIRGLNCEFSRGRGIIINGGSHNLIAGCTLRNMGDYAVVIECGTYNGVTGCDMYDLGTGAVILHGGDRKTLTPGNNFATNNHIHDYSQWYLTMQFAVLIEGVGNTIAHNLMHDAPHEVIAFGGNEHIIEFNEIHDNAKETGDVGATHGGRDWTYRGTIIRHNYYHHLHGPGLYGAMGVYLDDWYSGITIFGNVFYKAGRAAFIGGGRDNIVENNIFIECEPSVHVDARGLSWATYYFDKSLDIYVNTLFDGLEAVNFNKPPYSERYPELLTLLSDEPAVPKYNNVLRNVSYGGRWLDFYDGVNFSMVTVKDNLIADPVLCKWAKKLGGEFTVYNYGNKEMTDTLEGNGNILMDSDPGFVDYANQNFQFKDDSPAYKLGFKRIPVEQIGLYVDEYRKALP